mmetsp:Transcript_28694/g.91518  ORF Transcript_28694/g.91518 Transcript_28694/m.91518 type:complete len:211 (+) Transcript_28694:2374-3006(+)
MAGMHLPAVVLRPRRHVVQFLGARGGRHSQHMGLHRRRHPPGDYAPSAIPPGGGGLRHGRVVFLGGRRPGGADHVHARGAPGVPRGPGLRGVGPLHEPPGVREARRRRLHFLRCELRRRGQRGGGRHDLLLRRGQHRAGDRAHLRAARARQLQGDCLRVHEHGRRRRGLRMLVGGAVGRPGVGRVLLPCRVRARSGRCLRLPGPWRRRQR